jgi:hypothetical protein
VLFVTSATLLLTSTQVATRSPPQLGDRQESFWLAETLKYLLLLFRWGGGSG